MATIYYYDITKKKLLDVAFTENNLTKFSKKNIWIDMQNPSDSDLDLLRRKLSIHPTNIEDIKAQNSRAKVDVFRKYLFIVIYKLREGKEEYKKEEIDVIIGKNFVLTTSAYSTNQLKKIRNWRKLNYLFTRRSDVLLHYILDVNMNSYIPIIQKIEDEIDELEKEVSKHAEKKTLSKILKLRQDISFIRKVVSPQKDRILSLSKYDYQFISEDSIPYFRDLYDDLVRISDSLDEEKENMNSIHDTYMSTISFNLNEIIKILSIISTVMLPLTFLTGIFGMNFSIIPGLQNPTGFWVLMLVMAIIVIFQITFFKKQGWI